jgi:rare lipoprotein A
MDAGMQTLQPTVSAACTLSTFREVGAASWYGPEFHGQRTASGEAFDALALTVAHPSLPLGAVVEIQNLENGRRTLARVNDRGPFLKDRIVDCSFAVAHMLGFVAQGLARVQVTVLDSLAIVPPLLPGANMAMAAMEHLPPLRLANALVSRTAVHVPLAPAGAPLAVAAASSTEVRRATVVGTMTRKASVLPFPAIVQIYRHLLHLVMGPYGEWDPARGARVKLETFGLRDFVRLFTD